MKYILYNIYVFFTSNFIRVYMHSIFYTFLNLNNEYIVIMKPLLFCTFGVLPLSAYSTENKSYILFINIK